MMIFAYLGLFLCSLSLFVGSIEMALVGMVFIIFGVMFGYQPPQQDPVWKKLQRDGVLTDEDTAEPINWNDAYRWLEDR